MYFGRCVDVVRILVRQIIATPFEVTPNGALVRESPNNALNSGLGIIVVCPDTWILW